MNIIDPNTYIWVVEHAADDSGKYIFSDAFGRKFALLFTDGNHAMKYMKTYHPEVTDFCSVRYPDYEIHYSDLLADCDFLWLNLSETERIMINR